MEISTALLNKYNQPGPRYTSYPPANYFKEEFDPTQAIQCIEESNQLNPQSISLYVHIPFCPVLCHFCGCTTMIGRDEKTMKRYISALKTEIEMVAPLIDKNRKVTQVHWGGGTPNSIPLQWVDEVMQLFHKHFSFTPEAEVAMECSPAYLEYEHIDALRSTGFNRISLGIQDFNHDILEIINRRPPKNPVNKLLERIKQNGFKSVNLDLVYGLPGQSIKHFQESLERAIELKPERLVTFSYAHVPWMKKAQKQLEKHGLPGPDEKMSMLLMALNKLPQAGYVPIGIDHFAIPEDDLSKAYKIKQLHRNFQGYCTRETTGQVYAFGASSISQLEHAYIQNDKGVLAYTKSIEAGKLPVVKGYILQKEEKIIRECINSIMCNAQLNFNDIAALYNVTANEVKQITAFNPSQFEAMQDDGLLEMNIEGINLTQTGKLFARNVAMLLDPKLEIKQNMFSKTV